MRRLAAFGALALAAGVLGGCGGAEPGAGTTSPRPPTVEAVDEPAPDELAAAFRSFANIPRDAGEDRPDKRAFREAVVPAPGAEFRIVARLRLTGPREGIVLELVTWRSRSGALCTIAPARTVTGAEAGGVGPNGPCVPINPCRQLCVEQGLIEVGERGSSVAAGTVTADADELRVTMLGGGERRYALDGPLVTGAPGRRAFLLDLGRSSYARAELLRDGVVLETREDSAYDYATEDCIEAAMARDDDPEKAGCF